MDVPAALRQLKEAWANEKGAPELLTYKEYAVQLIRDEIQRQV